MILKNDWFSMTTFAERSTSRRFREGEPRAIQPAGQQVRGLRRRR
jgi:hypothetical protein